MAELIPLLSDLLYARCGFTVPDGFVESYVKLHDQDWHRAQDHWERVVRWVLDCREVESRATSRRAMQQAVAASGAILHLTPLLARCPHCRAGRRVP
ncbi:DUF6313 family protein [Actinomadura macrotermitis]|uniref:Uncharacterized protein n=1 Tax=Actinomadura macrotermitis TaxID=2585200 RepID=A0A7K0C1J3_9ACTN|nr:DUF6313 family protein [Actinomadura macrotermitis]MQY07299.1 hypothetical protein [Actinomadura macrotermitis]